MPQPRRAGLNAVLWATLLLGSALSAPAASAAVTDDQAQAVEREIHDWFQGLLGGAVAAPDRPVQLSPDGDSYALVIPLGTESAITGHLTPQDDGRWLLAGLKIPSPASFTVSIPTPGQNGKPPTSTDRTYQFSVARQETSGVLDPGYKTPSTLQQRYETLQLSSSGGGYKQTSQTARNVSQTTLTPQVDGRFDLASSGSLEGYLVDTQFDNGSSMHAVAERVRGTLQLGSISPDKGPAFLRSSIAFVAETFTDLKAAGGEPSHATPEQQERLRAGLRALVEALDGFASVVQSDYVLENVQVQAGGFSGIARRTTLGFGGDVPDGVLKIYLDLGVEGLSIPGLLAELGLPAQYADLVPTDVHLRPTLAGVGSKELLDLARQALDMPRGGMAPAPDPAPLFARGGVAAGLEAISFNFGPTKFAGRGLVTFTAPAPNAFTGQGQVTATNFDAMMDRAKQDPVMQQALALLTFAKGIGRSSGDQIVWDITYQDGKALVNGVDVMAMAAGAGGRADTRPAVRTPPPPAPAPTLAPRPSPGLKGKPPPK